MILAPFGKMLPLIVRYSLGLIGVCHSAATETFAEEVGSTEEYFGKAR
jgi:hypothetical protein